jgi:hypothetical protein
MGLAAVLPQAKFLMAAEGYGAYGSIFGSVTEDGGAGIPGVGLELYRWESEQEYWTWQDWIESEPDGSFEFLALVPDNYRVCTNYYGGDYVEECFDDAPAGDPWYGTDIPVLSDQATGPVEIALALGGSISGVVSTEAFDEDWYLAANPDVAAAVAAGIYASGYEHYVLAGQAEGRAPAPPGTPGEPVPYAQIDAYTWDDDNGYWRWVGHGWTEPPDDGRFVIRGLPEGVHRVCARHDDFVEQCYDNADYIEDATDIQVVSGADTSGIDMELSRAGRISGAVTDESGVPVSDIQATAYAWNPSGEYWEWRNSAWLSDWNAGQFEIGGLATGAYRVCFYDYESRFGQICYQDSSKISEAEDVHVTAGLTTDGVDQVVRPAGRITGRVTDSEGQPLAGVEVTPFPDNGDDAWWGYWFSSYTDANGDYQLDGLSDRNYRVCFWGDQYEWECFDNVLDVESATDIPVTWGETVSGIDASLSSWSPWISPDVVGTYRSTDGRFYVDFDGDGTWSGGDWSSSPIGGAGFTPLVGDWDGDGSDQIGLYLPFSGLGVFLLDSNGDGQWEESSDGFLLFGPAADFVPVAGDWNGDGRDEIGIYNIALGYWLLDHNGDGLWDETDDEVVIFGCPGCPPLVGDWDGNGLDDVGLFTAYNGFGLFLMDANGNRNWDESGDRFAVFGLFDGFSPVAGDWNADGTDDIGIYQGNSGLFLLDSNGNDTWDDGADVVAPFGQAGDLPFSAKP